MSVIGYVTVAVLSFVWYLETCPQSSIALYLRYVSTRPRAKKSPTNGTPRQSGANGDAGSISDGDREWLEKLWKVARKGSSERTDIDAMLARLLEHEPTREEVERAYIAVHTKEWDVLVGQLQDAGIDDSRTLEVIRKCRKPENLTKAEKPLLTSAIQEQLELSRKKHLSS